MPVNPFSSLHRPNMAGRLGAVAAAHPLAVAPGRTVLAEGGNAVASLIAAPAVLAVVSPDAGGLGGDGFVFLHRSGRPLLAIDAPAPPPGPQVRRAPRAVRR